eukprot:TRINITY_DN7639_c0_g1_i3.p1 TRINITY_DN7639_c0_g1~~TRINITY_DN7639_c0_g1_i3.p1  ORF type:complete len:233 (-),score=42.52 TRINITY_DN7639_c0_g1_i3:156-854(-)
MSSFSSRSCGITFSFTQFFTLFGTDKSVENVPGWSTEGKEKVISLLMNSDWQGVSFVPASVLTLKSENLATGLVVDVGASGVRCNAVLDGRVVSESSNLYNIMQLSGKKDHTSNEEWLKNPANASKILNALFKPTRGTGLVELVVSVLQKVKSREMASHIILTGGLSLVKGLKDQLSLQLASRYTAFPVAIRASSSPLVSSYVGAVRLIEDNQVTFITGVEQLDELTQVYRE